MPASSFACRIKEELGGSEHSQEAVAIGWQRFKQLTVQFSSGEIDSSCYLSSFLSLFPNDPHRRHTEVNRPAARFRAPPPRVCDALSSGAAACFESLRPRARATEKTCRQRTPPCHPCSPRLCLCCARRLMCGHVWIMQVSAHCSIVCWRQGCCACRWLWSCQCRQDCRCRHQGDVIVLCLMCSRQ